MLLLRRVHTIRSSSVHRLIMLQILIEVLNISNTLPPWHITWAFEKSHILQIIFQSTSIHVNSYPRGLEVQRVSDNAIIKL